MEKNTCLESWIEKKAYLEISTKYGRKRAITLEYG
jgi:hypothetical protein